IRNSLLTLVCSAVQFVCLIWFVLSYVPGGERGLRFITSIFTRVVKTQSKTVLPI
uniref:Vesicle transport protein n=1 Tax=Plectus sambesii TaxID=2011161 RepID=A0A914V697_9BILA